MPHRDVDPLSQLEVEALIRDLMKAAQRVTIEVGQRAQNAAVAETTYRVKYAQEYLKADGTVSEREHRATVACADELAARKVAEALLLSAREAGLNVRERMAGARTLASNVRSAVANATGTGG